MARAESKMNMGYLPIEPKHHAAILSLVAPAVRLLDPFAGEGKNAVRISYLKLIGGETDAAAYRQAVQLAFILIDGKWDGDTPIRIDDVYALAKKMKPLTAKDMALFSLEDFVQVGSAEPEPAAVDAACKTR
jgi:hypothetical protein